MSNQIVPDIYSAVILDVVNRIRQCGSEIEIEDGVLDDLQRTWLQKIMLSRVSDFPPQSPGREGVYGYGVAYENGFGVANQVPNNPTGGVQQQGYVGYGDYNIDPAQYPNDVVPDYPESRAESDLDQFRAYAEAGSQCLQTDHDAQDSQSPDKGVIQERNKFISSRNEHSVKAQDCSAIDSDLDDDDSEGELNSISHLVLCQYERVKRIKNKWKCALRDGIMNVNGRDYLFGKAQCEFEW